MLLFLDLLSYQNIEIALKFWVVLWGLHFPMVMFLLTEKLFLTFTEGELILFTC